MSSDEKNNDPLATLFREVVLVLGGVFAVRGTDDETMRQVAAGIERTWRRARRSQGQLHASGRLAPHPAIAALLRLTDEEEKE